MAKTLTQLDCYALMNELVAQATGVKDLAVVDTASFVSAGEQVLATGYENTLNALSLVLGRTLIAVRPYRAKLRTIQAMNTDMYSHRLRKISYYSRYNLPAGNFNTQLFPANLRQGYTNKQVTTEGAEATKSMWLQNQPQPFEMNFAGSDVWQTSTTVYQYQLKQAFKDEASFASFAAGIMTEKANDIERTKEAFNRMAVLAKIGQIYAGDNAQQKINLTKAFNDRFGTAYTSAELRSTHLKEFLQFMVSVVKLTSDRMEESSINFHKDFTKTVPNPETGEDEKLHILRHTPKALQHALLYGPLFTEAEAMVLPEIFNPQYLSLDNYESVTFWQSNTSEAVRPAVNVTTEEGTSAIPYVVGLLFDRDALVVDYQLDDAASTPLEARKHYYTIWWSFAKNVICDPSENAVLLYMEDESEGSDNRVGSAVVGTAEAGD